MKDKIGLNLKVYKVNVLLIKWRRIMRYKVSLQNNLSPRLSFPLTAQGYKM